MSWNGYLPRSGRGWRRLRAIGFAWRPTAFASAHLIFGQSRRLADIISELMDFAKPVPPTCVEADLADLIDRSLHDAKMQTETADRTIEVTLGDVPNVIVDAQQVSAALVEVI